MHERNVAHRDSTANNIMLDPSGMYPDGFHPTQINRRPDFSGRAKRHTRTRRPPRYYLIDFGLSRRYATRDAFDDSLRGGDRTAPEHQREGPCNPFQTDIYYLGNLIREKFIRVTFATALNLAVPLTECIIRNTTASSSCETWFPR
jgi:serine/threonine protein kinase